MSASDEKLVNLCCEICQLLMKLYCNLYTWYNFESRNVHHELELDSSHSITGLELSFTHIFNFEFTASLVILSND